MVPAPHGAGVSDGGGGGTCGTLPRSLRVTDKQTQSQVEMILGSWAMELLAKERKNTHPLPWLWAKPLRTSALAGATHAASPSQALHGAGVSDALQAACSQAGALTRATKYAGMGGRGQLGNGDVLDHSTPVLVSGSHSFTRISVGQLHTCGIDGAGAAWCWGERRRGCKAAQRCGTKGTQHVLLSFPCAGSNLYYQLGNEAYSWEGTPVRVLFNGMYNLTHISAGQAHTCAIHGGGPDRAIPTGTAVCWGE